MVDYPVKTGKDIGVDFIIAQDGHDLVQGIESERFWPCDDLEKRLRDVVEAVDWADCFSETVSEDLTRAAYRSLQKQRKVLLDMADACKEGEA